MKPIYSTIVLIVINLLSITIIVFTNIKAEDASKLDFLNETPTNITADIRPILIRGEVKKEGFIYINLNNEIIPTLYQLNLFNTNTDITKVAELYKDKLFNEYYSIFIPTLIKDKLYLNFSSQKDLSEFFSIDLRTSNLIISKRPYISLEDFKKEFPNVEIPKKGEIAL